MQITRKWTNKMEASYTLEGTVHLIPRSNNHTWLEMEYTYMYQQHVYKANRTLGFLKRNLYQCPQDGKEAAYKGLFPPFWNMAAVFGILKALFFNKKLKKVQNRAARFVTSNYSFETGSITGILENLKWESSRKGGETVDWFFLYKGSVRNLKETT